MPGANRHRPPSLLQLLERVYRDQLAIKNSIAALTKRQDAMDVVTEHCRRLLAEKATLLKIIEANRFMSQALPRRPATDGPPRVLYGEECRVSSGFGMLET